MYIIVSNDIYNANHNCELVRIIICRILQVQMGINIEVIHVYVVLIVTFHQRFIQLDDKCVGMEWSSDLNHGMKLL